MPWIKTALTSTLKTALCISCTLGSAALWAQDASVSAHTSNTAEQEAQKPVKPYGANPNIFHVWAYKTQEGVINTATRVGNATERGIGKIKPSVDQAWDNTKDLAENTAQKVDAGAQRATQNLNSKVQDTKEALGGKASQPAPIEQRSLSESSSSGGSSNSASPASSRQIVPNTAYPSSSTPTAYPVTDL